MQRVASSAIVFSGGDPRVRRVARAQRAATRGPAPHPAPRTPNPVPRTPPPRHISPLVRPRSAVSRGLMLRKTFLYLSNQPQIFRFVSNNRLAKHFARRFVAGERVDEALDAAKSLNAKGIT